MKKLSIPLSFLLLIPLFSVSQKLDLDKELGAQNAKMVELQMGIYEDPARTDYIRSVGQRLISQLEKPLFEYQFHLVPDMAPNAFALPGGYVYVTTGLLPILESEDELGCILAHEIIHANNRHSVRQLKKSIFPRLLELPGNLIGLLNKDLGAIFNAPIQTSNALLMASYSRGFETEADVEGIKIAGSAGYDPNAMISSLSRMSEAIEVAVGYKEEKSYFNDHPYTPDRTKTLEKNIAKLEWESKDAISDNFLFEFDSILFGESPNKGVVRENQFLHPDLNFFVEFPEDWTIENQPSNVGAYHPERKAAAFIALDDPTLNPEEAAQLFMVTSGNDYRDKMTDSQDYTINGRKGYLLTYQDKVEGMTMFAYLLWLPMDDKLFKLIGIAPIEYKPTLDKIGESVRTLSNSEKESFTINLMRVVEARKGETIKSLSERTGNVLNSDLTGVINSLDPDDILSAGEYLKVVIPYPYKSN
jgi:predicted Zn-dependent protease